MISHRVGGSMFLLLARSLFSVLSVLPPSCIHLPSTSLPNNTSSGSSDAFSLLAAKAFFGDFTKKELGEFVSEGLQGKVGGLIV